MKNITIAGRLGKNAVLRRTQDGDPVLGFTVAVDDRGKKEKETVWFDCALWGKRGESLAEHLTKGTAVTVSGDFGTREYEGRTYFTVRVNDVTLQGGGKSERQDTGGQSAGDFSQDLDDEIPFLCWGDARSSRMMA
jgi:single-strand DNA-binding protein